MSYRVSFEACVSCYRFFDVNFLPSEHSIDFAMTGHYNLLVVALSIIVSCLSSVVALRAVFHAKDTPIRREQNIWMGISGGLLGAGIWSMHFLGMLAYKVPADIQYDLLATFVSFLPGLASGAVICWQFRRPSSKVVHQVLVALLIGSGIGAMHFTGIGAMRMSDVVVYKPTPFLMSLAIAVFGSLLVVWSLNKTNQVSDMRRRRRSKYITAVVQGLSVPAVHYSAMHAMVMIPGPTTLDTSSQLHEIVVLAPIASFVCTLIVLTLVMGPLKTSSLNGKIMAAYFQKSSDGIVVADSFGRIVQFNPTAENIFGYSKSEVIGKNVSLLLPIDKRDEHDKSVQAFQRRESDNVLGMQRQLMARNKEGDLVPVEVHLSTATVGGLRTLIASIHDISKEWRLQEMQRKVNEALQEALEEKTRQIEQQNLFVSMVSHEFRTPLAIIDGAAQRMQRSGGDFNAKRMLELTASIRKSVRRLINLMESSLLLGKADNTVEGTILREVAVDEFLSDLHHEMSGLYPTHDLQLLIDDRIGTIPIDEEAVTQILANLISNAVKYSPPGSRVGVRASRDVNSWRVAIEDQGVGISEEDLENVFSLYFRANTASGVQGTGLGLGIAKSIAEGLGGSLTAKSILGVGTEFVLRLPSDLQSDSQGLEDAV